MKSDDCIVYFSFFLDTLLRIWYPLEVCYKTWLIKFPSRVQQLELKLFHYFFLQESIVVETWIPGTDDTGDSNNDSEYNTKVQIWGSL